MGRFLWSGTVFCLGLAASLLGNVGKASACSPPPDGWFLTSIAPPPENGVVMLGFTCDSRCDPQPPVEDLVLKDEDGERVPGSVVFSQSTDSKLDVAFRPEAGAVAAAGLYTAEVEGVPTTEVILVGPAATWNDALMPAVDIVEVDHPTGEPLCCSGPVDSCGGTPCFRTQVERRTTVTVSWQDSVAIERYQYAYRLGRDGIDPATPWTWAPGDIRFELEATENEACFVLELKRLVDDTVQSFASRCIERPESFTPGLHETPEEDVASVLAACDEPLLGYESVWCEARKETCEVSPDEPWCAAFVARCAMNGAGGRAGAGGTAGSSGAQGGKAGGNSTGGATSTSGSGGTGDAGAPDEGEAGGKRVLTKAGCGCNVPGGSPRDSAAFVLALALTGWRVRRRRSRRHG